VSDPARHVLLLGAGDLAAETEEALRAAGAPVTRLEDPGDGDVRDALAHDVDAVAIVERGDAWPVRAALLVRHLDPDVPIVVTIFDRDVGRHLEREIGNCRVTSLAEIVAPSLAGPCIDPEFAAVLDGESACALRVDGDEVEEVPLPEQRPRRLRALSTAVLHPFDRSGRLVFFGALGLIVMLLVETVGAVLVLDQKPIDSFYGAIKSLATVGPNDAVADGPSWFKGLISVTMVLTLLSAACFTGGLVERLINRRLTGLVGSRAVPRREHVVVIGLGQVGIRLCLLLRACGMTVVAVDPREDGENVGHARELGLPVVIGRGADPSLLGRLRLVEAHALAAVTSDDLENIAVAIAALAKSQDLRVVLRAGSDSVGGETRSLARLGHVRDVHRMGAAFIAGVALGSEAESLVVVGGEPRLRYADGRLESFPFNVLA
jgi:voltage-gated potassium channel Kch